MEVSEPEWEVSNSKDGRADLSVLTTSSHYIGSRQNGLLAGRWKSVKGKLSKINFYQHQALSNIKIDQYRQLFNQQKSSRPARDGSDRASEASKIFAKIPTETLTKPIRIFGEVLLLRSNFHFEDLIFFFFFRPSNGHL